MSIVNGDEYQRPIWKSKQLDAHVGKTYDMVICSVPWTETDMPLMAPAALKPIVEKAGFSCLAVDLNVEVVQQSTISVDRTKYIQFFTNGFLDESIKQEVINLFNTLSDQILQVNPKFVGISVFTFSSRVATKYLCEFIKIKNANVQILIGGAGCAWSFNGPADLVDELKKLNLIDHHIKGDAENSLYHFLIGNKEYPGINNNNNAWKNLDNQELAMLPMPNYENYLFNFYKIKAMPIIGSRGCVKRCTFCDYVTHWNKFQWRTAENIFDEMISQYQKYKIRHFKFQDSLINGGLKEFNKLCAILANYNENNPKESFKWSSFFVLRDWTPSSEKAWELIAKSGAVQLNVGTESFSQAVRYAMGKKYSDASIIKHFEQAQKYGIHIRSLHIVGYITETQTDIDLSKQWLRDNTRFIDTVSFDWGAGLAIIEHTYLADNKDKLGIKLENNNPMTWTSRHTDSTAEKRKAWTMELRELSALLGFTVTATGADNHYLLEQSLIETFDVYTEHII
jgi:hypothetical protein